MMNTAMTNTTMTNTAMTNTTITSIDIYSDASHNKEYNIGVTVIHIPQLRLTTGVLYTDTYHPEFDTTLSKCKKVVMNNAHLGSSNYERLGLESVMELIKSLRMLVMYSDITFNVYLDSNAAITHYSDNYLPDNKTIIHKIPGHPKKKSNEYSPEFAVVDKMSHNICKHVRKYITSKNKGIVNSKSESKLSHLNNLFFA